MARLHSPHLIDHEHQYEPVQSVLADQFDAFSKDLRVMISSQHQELLNKLDYCVAPTQSPLLVKDWSRKTDVPMKEPVNDAFVVANGMSLRAAAENADSPRSSVSTIVAFPNSIPAPPVHAVRAPQRRCSSWQDMGLQDVGFIPTMSINALKSDSMASAMEGGRRKTQIGTVEQRAKFDGAKLEKSMLNFKSRLDDPTPLEEEAYDVSAYYFKDGWAQQVARSDWFSNLTMSIITINAVYIGVEMDNNTAEAPQDAAWPYQLSDHCFCSFFTVELVVRFLAFESKRDCFRDNWFKFDFALVTLMIGETWLMQFCLTVFNIGGSGLPTGPFRLLRLMRLARMTRLLRALPELVTMIKGLAVGARAVASSLLLLLGMLYVFAIILFLGLADAEEFEHHFGTLGLCMWTLMVDGIYMDDIGILRELLDGGFGYMVIVFMSFVLLAQMTVINMLIGVLCEVVSAVAQAETEALAVKTLKHVVLSLLLEIDEDGSGMIEKNEIKEVFENQHALEILDGLQVDVVHMFEWLNMMYEEVPALSIRFVMQAIMAQRGDRSVTMCDLVDAHNFSRWSTEKMEDRIKMDFTSQFEKLYRSVEELKTESTSTVMVHNQADFLKY